MCPEVLQKVAHLGNIDHLKIEVENWPALTERIKEDVVQVEEQQVFHSICKFTCSKLLWLFAAM